MTGEGHSHGVSTPGVLARWFARTTLPPQVAPLYGAVIAGGLACIAAAIVVAAGLVPVAQLTTPPLVSPGAVWPVTLAFGGLFLLLQRQGFVFHWRTQSTKISLDEIALFLGALALPPAHVVLGVVGSSVVNQLIHHRDPVKASYNVAQYAIAASAAVLTAVALRALQAPVPLPSIVAPFVFSTTTAWLVAALFHHMGDGSTRRIFQERFGNWALISSTLGVSLGVILYGLWQLAPVAVLAAVPIFFYLRRFGRLSEWADDELTTHKMLAAMSAQVAGRSDLSSVAEQVISAAHELFDCGEARLILGSDPNTARVWRTSFGAGPAGSGGVTTPVVDAHGARMGELTVFPQPGQTAYGEREHHLLRTIAANAAAAAANARALQAAIDANQQLVRSERRYRALFETANVFIHVIDRHGRVLDMNPAAFAALGHRGEDVIARPLAETLVVDHGSVDDLMSRLEKDNCVQGVVASFRTAGGALVPVLLDAQELEGNEDGARYVISSRDVTSLIAMERELRQSMASQRETIRRLENMNRELEEFTLWTTHDMREPLRSIGAIAQILHEEIGTITPDEARDLARRIHAGSDRLKDRVKALHAFSRIVQRDDAFADVSVQAVVEDVLSGLETKIRECSARIVLPETELPTVRAQPERLHQVFANLVENALKYCDASSAVVAIGCEELEDEWRFVVRDNGPGIPPAFHDRIFHLFQRGPGATSESGSGAGLAIVKRIAEQHGGRAWVESEPGHGAAFYVALPRFAEAATIREESPTTTPVTTSPGVGRAPVARR